MQAGRKYVILGSGIAGMAAAEAIREKDGQAKILMISAEKELCFNRPMLIREFALDGSGAALFDRQQNWPAQFDVDIRLSTAAVKIDRAEKTVMLADGTQENYDVLIYTLGAEVTIPPIPGADQDHVYVVRTRDDMKKIRMAMEKAKSAVVIGGGMLGLEDAWALCEEKLNVAIVEQKQRVAFGQIDQSAGNLMKKRIERWNVPVYGNSSVEEIGTNYVTIRQEGEVLNIPADLVILSTGVTPNSGLGIEAGLAGAGPGGRWIAVDEHCRTSDPYIFAAGDAAAVNGRNDAIWDEARQMGRTAGLNAVGMKAMDSDMIVPDGAGSDEADFKATDPEATDPKAAGSDALAVYEPVVAEHVFTGFDTQIFTMGDSSGAGTDGVYIRHADVEIFDYQRERYIRISLQDKRIVGILLINASELAPELMEAYHKGAGEEEARQIVLAWIKSHDVDFAPAEPFTRR